VEAQGSADHRRPEGGGRGVDSGRRTYSIAHIAQNATSAPARGGIGRKRETVGLWHSEERRSWPLPSAQLCSVVLRCMLPVGQEMKTEIRIEADCAYPEIPMRCLLILFASACFLASSLVVRGQRIQHVVIDPKVALSPAAESR
jgi:hypothetical protein